MFARIFSTSAPSCARHNLAVLVTVLVFAVVFNPLTRVYAEEPATPKTLAWGDLIPSAPASEMAKTTALRDRFVALKPADQDLYRRVEMAIELERELAAGTRKAEELQPGEREIIEENLIISHPDIVQFWKEVNEMRAAARVQNETVRADLNGARVRIPGYMLPLDLEGQAVREFLLVPYVGACIHTPPPPLNQIVFVKSTEGITGTRMFEPIWVTGQLSTEGGSHELYMADGRGDVDVGYSLDAVAVEPYEK